jgi:hypothetical protein
MVSQLSAEYLAQDRRPQARIGISVVTALSGIVVLIRVYARYKFMKSFGYDDGLICLAMVTVLCRDFGKQRRYRIN